MRSATETLVWRWSGGDSPTLNGTRAGIVWASVSAADASVVTVFGAITQRTGALECILDGGDAWVEATHVSYLHEGFSHFDWFRRVFRHRHPDLLTSGPPSVKAGSVRFRCPFRSGLALAGRTFGVRMQHWQIDGVPVRAAGFPVAQPLAAAAAPPRVTVCVQYMYGLGYTSRALTEFLAWYQLLGAHNFILFDDMEPHRFAHRDSAEVALAQQRRDAIASLAQAPAARLTVVRGLCTHEFMLRTSIKCQVLAGNMCMESAAAAGAGAYTLPVDIDEFLTPPVAFGPLTGALQRLAEGVGAGTPVSVLGRVLRHPGLGACIKFVGIYYTARPCGDGTSETRDASADDGLGVSRLAYRTVTDNFEEGPSYEWTTLRWWDWRVHAKYLQDATVPNATVGIHSCCLLESLSSQVAAERAAEQAARPEQLGGVEAIERTEGACARVEHAPLESWRIRHLREAPGSSCADYSDPRERVHARLWRGGRSSEVDIYPDHVAFDPLPAAWQRDAQASYEELLRQLKP